MSLLRRIDFIFLLIIIYTLIYILLSIIHIYKKGDNIEKSYNFDMAGNRQQFEYIVNIYIVNSEYMYNNRNINLIFDIFL